MKRKKNIIKSVFLLVTILFAIVIVYHIINYNPVHIVSALGPFLSSMILTIYFWKK